jgi:hypothetical protein
MDARALKIQKFALVMLIVAIVAAAACLDHPFHGLVLAGAVCLLLWLNRSVSVPKPLEGSDDRPPFE